MNFLLGHSVWTLNLTLLARVVPTGRNIQKLSVSVTFFEVKNGSLFFSVALDNLFFFRIFKCLQTETVI